MKTVGIVISWLLFLVFVPPSAAEVVSTIEYKYYTVNITSKDDAAKNAFSVTPIRENGKPFLGYTSCKTRYRYWHDQNADMCRLNRYTVNNDCVVTLPRFVGGEAMLQRTLAMFVEKLKEHELVHCRISLEHANKYDRLLSSFGRHRCDELAGALEIAYRKVHEEAGQAQKRFDVMGDHGRHEGANIKWFLSQFPQSQGPSGSKAGIGAGRTRKGSAGNSPKNGPAEEPMEHLSNYYKDENGVWKNYK